MASPAKALKLGFGLFVALAVAVFAASYIGIHVPLDADRVALVRVEGPILDARETVETIQAHTRDAGIRALVLRVDSPGGGVVASQEMHDAVLEFKKTGRPVVASMGTVAASGGYYISAPADLIVANPGTLTGSIGVIMSMANVESLMDKIGVQNITLKAGANKDIGSPFRTMTDADRALLQGVMDDIHAQFIEAVADGRSRSVTEITLLADGRVYTGRQAMAVGLVDEMGNLDSAVRRAGELAGIKGRPRVIEHEKSALERLTTNLESRLGWLSLGGHSWSGMRAMYMMTPVP